MRVKRGIKSSLWVAVTWVSLVRDHFECELVAQRESMLHRGKFLWVKVWQELDFQMVFFPPPHSNISLVYVDKFPSNFSLTETVMVKTICFVTRLDKRTFVKQTLCFWPVQAFLCHWEKSLVSLHHCFQLVLPPPFPSRGNFYSIKLKSTLTFYFLTGSNKPHWEISFWKRRSVWDLLTWTLNHFQIGLRSCRQN